MLLAYTLKGMAGFGSGLLTVPVLALFLPLTTIVPMLGLISYSGTVIQSVQLRKKVRWKDCLIVLPFSALGVVLALWIFKNIELIWLNKALAIFVIIYALMMILPQRPVEWHRNWGVPSGFFAGLVGALFGTGGPFYVIYLKLRQLNKNSFRATIAMIFLFDGAIRIVGYGFSGFYTADVLMLALISLPLLFLGLFMGHRIHLSISNQLFTRVISVLLLCSGLILLFK